jgi:2-hydroxychromene-2-carboxylate isomerase
MKENMQQIEFMYDFASPNAYLVHKVLPQIAREHNAHILFRPVLIGGVFKATNNTAPLMAFTEVKGKIRYLRAEFARFVERYQVSFHFNSVFPLNTLNVMRGGVFASGKEWENNYIDAVFNAVWVDDKNMSDLNVVSQVLEAADVPVQDIMNAMQDVDIKSKLADVTSTAVERKVFGLPTIFLNDEMFYGKDSLNDLTWRLGQQ